VACLANLLRKYCSTVAPTCPADSLRARKRARWAIGVNSRGSTALRLPDTTTGAALGAGVGHQQARVLHAPVPGAMFVNGDPPALHVRLVHKRTEFDVHVDPNATFGELRVRTCPELTRCA